MRYYSNFHVWLTMHCMVQWCVSSLGRCRFSSGGHMICVTASGSSLRAASFVSLKWAKAVAYLDLEAAADDIFPAACTLAVAVSRLNSCAAVRLRFTWSRERVEYCIVWKRQKAPSLKSATPKDFNEGCRRLANVTANTMPGRPITSKLTQVNISLTL